MKRSLVRLGLVSATALAATGLARADLLFFRGPCDAAQTKTKNNSPATGLVLGVLDTGADTFAYYVTYRDYDDSGNNASHFHGPAAPGVFGPGLHTVNTPGANLPPDVGVWNVDAAQAAHLVDELVYYNLHTDLLPPGEIRGQILRDPTRQGGYRTVLDADQLTTASSSALTGTGVFLIDTDEDVLAYVIDVPGAAATEVSAGIHGYAPRGSDGALLHALPLGDSKIGFWSYPPGDEAALLAGEAYVQIATTAHPSGAIRGQVVQIPPGTWVVDPSGTADFDDLQRAIDVVPDGSTILVETGTYAPITLDDRALTIVERNGATAEIAGTIEVKNLGAGRTVVLSGLDAAGVTPAPGSAPDPIEHAGLVVTDCTGPVRVVDGSFTGADNLVDPPGGACTAFFGVEDGWHGAYVATSLDVAFTSCTFAGGDGMHFVANTTCHDNGTPGGDGTSGVFALDARTALYECVATGGTGGDASSGGHGGAGYEACGFGTYLSGCTSTGGNGGFGFDFLGGDGGDGGHGLVVETAQAQSLDSVLAGGLGGGSSFFSPGADGAPSSGSGVVVPLAGTARALLAPALASPGDTLVFSFDGVAGDIAYLHASDKPAFEVLIARSEGIGLTAPPRDELAELSSTGRRAVGIGGRDPHHLVPLPGDVPPGGTLSWSFTLTGQDALFTGRVLHLQSLHVDAAGDPALGSYRALVVER